MNPNRDSNAIGQLTAMVGQLVRQNQTLIGHIDRVATSTFELSTDMRAHQAANAKSLEQVRAELQSVRTEIHARFDAVGTRFDETEERLARLERAVHDLRSDLLRLEDGILSAQQSALQAHLRIDDDTPPTTHG